MERFEHLKTGKMEKGVTRTEGYLLDDLAALCGYEFLSDLRVLPVCRGKLLSALKSIDPAAYSLWDWNDAADYLFGPTPEFQTIHEAHAFMLRICEAVCFVNGQEC